MPQTTRLKPYHGDHPDLTTHATSRASSPRGARILAAWDATSTGSRRRSLSLSDNRLAGERLGDIALVWADPIGGPGRDRIAQERWSRAIAANERDQRDSTPRAARPLAPSSGLQRDRRDPWQRAQRFPDPRGAAARERVGGPGSRARALKSRQVCPRADCLRLTSPTDVLWCPHSMSFNAPTAVPARNTGWVRAVRLEPARPDVRCAGELGRLCCPRAWRAGAQAAIVRRS